MKTLAVLVFLLPNLPVPIKEWAYAGVMLFYLTALVAHIAHKDSVGISILLIVLSAITITSYYTMNKILN